VLKHGPEAIMYPYTTDRLAIWIMVLREGLHLAAPYLVPLVFAVLVGWIALRPRPVV
jgi:hypothetical protein